MQIIPSNRLFYGSDPVGNSPYTVTVSPHKPSQPLEVSLAVEAWDEVRVSFMPPENDGGEAVEGYMVEWWSATTTASDAYGSPEVQTLKIGGDVDGEKQNTHSRKSIDLVVTVLIDLSKWSWREIECHRTGCLYQTLFKSTGSSTFDKKENFELYEALNKRSGVFCCRGG